MPDNLLQRISRTSWYADLRWVVDAQLFDEAARRDPSTMDNYLISRYERHLRPTVWISVVTAFGWITDNMLTLRSSKWAGDGWIGSPILMALRELAFDPENESLQEIADFSTDEVYTLAKCYLEFDVEPEM